METSLCVSSSAHSLFYLDSRLKPNKNAYSAFLSVKKPFRESFEIFLS